MALGVEKEWAKQFEGIYNQQPSWYNGPGIISFSAVAFASSLSDFSGFVSGNAAGGSSFSGGGGGGGGDGW